MVDNKHGLQHFLKKTGIYFTSVLFLCATVSSILGTYVSAQEQDTGKKCDQSFYSSNNILFMILALLYAVKVQAQPRLLK